MSKLNKISHYTLMIIFGAALLFLIMYVPYELARDVLQDDKGIATFHYIAIVVLTLMLVWVAWHQLYKVRRRSRADFLMKIDTRYCSPESVKARIIIHKLYHQTNKSKNDNERAEEIGNEILKKRTNDAEEFILLINFLDLLETIAFFTMQRYVEKDEISELSGNSIVHYYRVFKPWVEHRQNKQKPYHENDYKTLEQLANEIEKKRTNKADQ